MLVLGWHGEQRLLQKDSGNGDNESDNAEEEYRNTGDILHFPNLSISLPALSSAESSCRIFHTPPTGKRLGAELSVSNYHHHRVNVSSVPLPHPSKQHPLLSILPRIIRPLWGRQRAQSQQDTAVFQDLRSPQTSKPTSLTCGKGEGKEFSRTKVAVVIS